MSYQRREELAEGVVLYLGDMLDILPTLGEFDACVTDPPYGIGRANGAHDGGTDASGKYVRRPRQYDGTWDDEMPSDDAFHFILNATRIQIIWGGNFFVGKLPVGGKWLAWDKLNSMPTFSDMELAWSSLCGASVKKFTQCASGLAANRDGRVHPTQKPLALMEWCIDQLPADVGTILDPFMGSGTTGVAAVKKGKAFYGIEREPKYFDISCRRISDALKRPDLFIPAPAPKAKQESLL